MVKLSIVGKDNGSDEYNAAVKIQQFFSNTIPNESSGEIIICPNVTFFGQTVKDVDILIAGQLQNCRLRILVNDDGERKSQNVEVDSFCTTIEVKSHNVDGISRIGTDWYVQYRDGKHNVTEQSNKQKISARNYFMNALSSSPFMSNVIWFTEINKDDYKLLAKEGKSYIVSNVLSHHFTFLEFIQLVADQKTLFYRNGTFVLDSGINEQKMTSIKNVINFFTVTKTNIGNITRSKMELITQKRIEKYDLIDDSKELKVLRGKAGTGKTIELIRTGLKIIDEYGERVLILTYNRALVSDLRRLFSLTELPDMFSEACISIMTMQSYFYQLINNTLYEGKLRGDVFLQKYEYYLNEMKDLLLIDDNAKDEVWRVCRRNDRLNWDYILIDEAQDWTELEKEIVVMLFDQSKIIVADGGTQFVRNIDGCNWMSIDNAKSIRLKYCLRQKNNIIKFINSFIIKQDKPSKRIVGSEELVGGKVIICTKSNEFFGMLSNEKARLIENGNIGYDLLVLTSSDYVTKEYNNKHFSLVQDFEENGFRIWDATNDDNRLDFPVNPDQSRVIQYESARGLEGWTVCCLGFDKWVEEKMRQFDSSKTESTLFLQSKEDQFKDYLLNWILLPFSRALDTLIICIEDIDSTISQQLLEIAEEHKDYVDIV